ncbi:hypothetical protein T4A_7577 [Trichinella pseudospiralis]|uniref:Uncharacterized protein n=1 Tax=Trichinella pseudospiralis TaxID=6337 RepID=A0A0V1EDX3_TRIPS|nr:hypothetical protein T4A_7577 [Trichinella pseudospiralis]KRZ31881.1 hypothetical protein T4C_9986 [Trichinella pseudospiralis]
MDFAASKVTHPYYVLIEIKNLPIMKLFAWPGLRIIPPRYKLGHTETEIPQTSHKINNSVKN